MRKLEDITEKSTQTMLVIQKNVENLETQFGQLAQELMELWEKCKLVTTRSGIVVGRGIGDDLKSEERDMESEERRKSEERKIERKRKKRRKKKTRVKREKRKKKKI